MNKYIDAEKLIAEIERLGSAAYENYTRDNSDKEYWTYMTCKKISNCIATLQQEPPEVDLEEEMTAYIERHFHIRYDETLEVGNDPLTTHDFEKIASHFWNKGYIAGKEV